MNENKRYYWLKLKENFFTQRDIKVIKSMDNGPDYIIFWQQLLLMSITSSDIGVLRYKDNIPFTPELLATITDTNVDIVKGALSTFQGLGMIERSENGDIIIDELIHDLIGSETSVAERVRKHRDKKRSEMLQCNNVKQICNTEIELEKEIELDKEKTVVISEPLKNKTEEKKDNILEIWLSFKKDYPLCIKSHRNSSIIKTKHTKISEADLKEAITNYCEVVTSDLYWYNKPYVKGLVSFLENIDQWIDIDRSQYLSTAKKTEVQSDLDRMMSSATNN